MHETGCSGLVHGMTQSDWMGRELGRGVQDGEHMYTRGWFMPMYGKNHHNIIKLLASNENKLKKTHTHMKRWLIPLVTKEIKPQGEIISHSTTGKNVKVSVV